ncbi:MAG: NAD(P)-dependent oxidoreductase [Deltaproteobacteria bacterium]|nr:NAD(P)-dependent oxidoreductase [Deltaproteobacteria bacterium]
MNVLVTGANGFIGRAICSRLASCNKVIGVYHIKKPVNSANITCRLSGIEEGRYPSCYTTYKKGLVTF